MSANGSPPFPPFAVTVVRDDVRVAVALQGELDLASAGELARAVHELWSSGDQSVLIDLEALEFLDSSGLRALLALQDAARLEGRDLALRPGPFVVQRIFDLTGTRGLFHWRSSEPPARRETERTTRFADPDATPAGHRLSEGTRDER